MGRHANFENRHAQSTYINAIILRPPRSPHERHESSPSCFTRLDVDSVKLLGLNKAAYHTERDLDL
jgi:hypothetical protein